MLFLPLYLFSFARRKGSTYIVLRVWSVCFTRLSVFHMACWPRVGYSVENPVKTAKNNILAGSTTLNFARKVGAKRVIYSSSSSVVGNGNGNAF